MGGDFFFSSSILGVPGIHLSLRNSSVMPVSPEPSRQPSTDIFEASRAIALLKISWLSYGAYLTLAPTPKDESFCPFKIWLWGGARGECDSALLRKITLFLKMFFKFILLAELGLANLGSFFLPLRLYACGEVCEGSCPHRAAWLCVSVCVSMPGDFSSLVARTGPRFMPCTPGRFPGGSSFLPFYGPVSLQGFLF